jgi:Zn-dependent protease
VVLLFIHEMGHVLQLRREGIQASAPMFIPFLGAVISAKSLGRDAAAEARVGLAGPILGTPAPRRASRSPRPRATTSSARWRSSGSS